jgi:hypothetical protein
MTRSATSKEALISTCEAIITNLPALLGAGTITAGGTTYTKAAILAPLETYVAAPPATSNAKTAYSKTVKAETAAKKAALLMIDDVIKPFLQLQLGKTSEELTKYGLEPAKVTERSAETKAAAAKKAQATRKALGTMGSAQKKAAKKALAAQAETPTAPATPATPVKA